MAPRQNHGRPAAPVLRSNAGFLEYSLDSRRADSSLGRVADRRLLGLETSPAFTLSAIQLQKLLSEPTAGQVLAWTEKLDEPLEGEMHLVVSDAKLALHSLTANFLPEREF